MPRASVIIPTYNRADMVGQAIQSVLDQTCDDWELIVVDDGSQDNTHEVVKSYDDPRILYIYQDNKKLPGARNTGIEASSGDYIAFLDSDDLFLPDKLQTQMMAITRNPDIGLVASGWTETDPQQNPLQTVSPWLLEQGLALKDWLYNCPLVPPCVLVRRDQLLEVGLFDEEQHYVEDWDLWLRLAYAGCQMAWEPATVCLKTIHNESMVKNVVRMSAGVFRLFDKFFAQSGVPESIRQQKDLVYANAHLDSSVRAFSAGEPGVAGKHLRAAIHLNQALLDGEPPEALQSLASTALTQLVSDMDKYVDDICKSLPDVSPELARSPRQMHAMIRATAAFEDLAYGRRRRARLQAGLALLSDPVWFRNRGLLGILLKP